MAEIRSSANVNERLLWRNQAIKLIKLAANRSRSKLYLRSQVMTGYHEKYK